jgi:hypothetical protein
MEIHPSEQVKMEAQKMDMSLSISCDIIFECEGNKFYFEDVKVNGGECFMDGTN